MQKLTLRSSVVALFTAAVLSASSQSMAAESGQAVGASEFEAMQSLYKEIVKKQLQKLYGGIVDCALTKHLVSSIDTDLDAFYGNYIAIEQRKCHYRDNGEVLCTSSSKFKPKFKGDLTKLRNDPACGDERSGDTMVLIIARTGGRSDFSERAGAKLNKELAFNGQNVNYMQVDQHSPTLPDDEQCAGNNYIDLCNQLLSHEYLVVIENSKINEGEVSFDSAKGRAKGGLTPEAMLYNTSTDKTFPLVNTQLTGYGSGSTPTLAVPSVYERIATTFAKRAATEIPSYIARERVVEQESDIPYSYSVSLEGIPAGDFKTINDFRIAIESKIAGSKLVRDPEQSNASSQIVRIASEIEISGFEMMSILESIKADIGAIRTAQQSRGSFQVFWGN